MSPAPVADVADGNATTPRISDDVAKPAYDPEHAIDLGALKLIEEIACNMCGDGSTEEGRALNRIYELAHYAMAPDCRKNHPEFGRGIAEIDWSKPR